MIKKSLLFILISGFVLFVARGFFIEPNQLIVKKQTLELPNWPKKDDNFKIAIIADLHAGAPFINTAKIEKIVNLTNKEKPDIIFLLGDYVAYRVIGARLLEPEITANMLKNLKAPYGIIAVLGNHDWRYNGKKVWKAFESAHIKVLENNAVKIKIKNGYLWIGGLADLETRYPDIYTTMKDMNDSNPIIILSHHPDMFRFVPQKVSLTISGHTHCGQVFLPFLGRPVIPSNFGQLYAIGHIEENNRNLFVSCGIGTSDIPVRFRVKPEINILTIKSIK